jgi:hypothetical protein
LSKKILFDRLENCNISAVMVEDVVNFIIEPPMLAPVVNEDGYIVLDQIDPTV